MSARGHQQLLMSYGGELQLVRLFSWPANTGVPVLGDNNNLYADYSGDGGNKGKRLSIDGGGAFAETYSAASFGFPPMNSQHKSRNAMPDSNVMSGSFGIIRALDDLGDGTYYNYTSGQAIGGNLNGPCWIDATNGWGNWVSGLTYYFGKFNLNTGAMTFDETVIKSSASSFFHYFFRNGASISNKVYYSDTLTTISYVNTTDDSLNNLVTGSTFIMQSNIIGSDGYLYTGQYTGAGTKPVLRQRLASDGSVNATVDVSNVNGTTTYWIYEAPSGMLWLQSTWNNGFAWKMIEIDPATMQLTGRRTGEMGTYSPLGITEDGRMVFYGGTPAGIATVTI